jgi:AraC-like DNA-binding protein
MGRPRRELPLPSALPAAILRDARAHGVDAGLLAQRVGLDVEAEGRDAIAITPSALRDLFEAAAASLGEPFLALRLATELPAGAYGFAELSARASPTVGDAAAHLARYAALVHPELESSFEVTETGADWHARSPQQPRGLGRHAHEYGLAYLLAVVRVGSGEPIAPTRVWFGHSRPPDIAPLFRFFGTQDVAFGEAESGLTLSARSLGVPMLGQDPRLLATAKGLAEGALSAHPRRQAFAELVEKHVVSLLPRGADMGAVARALHMSPRTLQRRLEDEGTAFSDVLDDVRQSAARQRLRDPALSLSEIAYELGFADLATFSRAFKRWTGMPPGMWRGR